MIDLNDTRIPRLNLKSWQKRGLELAVGLASGIDERIESRCPAIIKRGHERYVGKQCRKPAGQGTWHVGFGHCIAHGGAKREGRAEGSWLMAFAYADEMDVSPWEALLYVIRITAGRVRYCEQVLATAKDDRELEGRVSVDEPLGVSETGELTEGRNLSWWVDTSERERVLLAKVSKAAIDAGVAQLLVEQTLREGNDIADGMLGVWHTARESGEFTKQQMDLLLEFMKLELSKLDAKMGGSQGKNLESPLPLGTTVEGSVIKSDQGDNDTKME